MVVKLLQRMGFHPHYTSTYCIHENHAQCRLVCKTCHAYCRCKCHRPQGAAWWIIERIGRHAG